MRRGGACCDESIGEGRQCVWVVGGRERDRLEGERSSGGVEVRGGFDWRWEVCMLIGTRDWRRRRERLRGTDWGGRWPLTRAPSQFGHSRR